MLQHWRNRLFGVLQATVQSSIDHLSQLFNRTSLILVPEFVSIGYCLLKGMARQHRIFTVYCGRRQSGLPVEMIERARRFGLQVWRYACPKCKLGCQPKYTQKDKPGTAWQGTAHLKIRLKRVKLWSPQCYLGYNRHQTYPNKIKSSTGDMANLMRRDFFSHSCRTKTAVIFQFMVRNYQSGMGGKASCFAHSSSSCNASCLGDAKRIAQHWIYTHLSESRTWKLLFRSTRSLPAYAQIIKWKSRISITTKEWTLLTSQSGRTKARSYFAFFFIHELWNASIRKPQ